MTILLFGLTRDIVGSNALNIPITSSNHRKQPATVGELRQFLKEKHPELGRLSSLAVAVNNTYAADDTPLHVNDEIALIPPVSGG